MHYQPGTHLIATLTTAQTALLQTHSRFQQLADSLIEKYNLQKLGEVYHDFSPAGFTGVVCLSESHLSVHTWPEHGRVNVDIYLSNFQRNNDGTVQELYEAICNHFGGDAEAIQTIRR